MRRNLLLVFIFFACSLLSAAEWSWETKGFPFQRIRIGEDGEWREIPSYVDSCISTNTPLGTTLSIQWATQKGAWLEELTEIVEDNDIVPVISAGEYVEVKRESQEVNREMLPSDKKEEESPIVNSAGEYWASAPNAKSNEKR